MISIRKSDKLGLWTLYIRGKGVAGLTQPAGFFAGRLIVCSHPSFTGPFHIAVMFKGRKLL